MTRTAETITVGEWAVLGVLAEAPTHGFAIAKALAPDGAVGRVWSMRRPLVYRALDVLGDLGFVAPAGTMRSREGPRRMVLELTPAGRAAYESWLTEPVVRVRDGRSLLLIKLLFHDRAGRDPTRLLEAQRVAFGARVDALSAAIADTDGFERTLLEWRLHATTAAVDFVEEALRTSGYRTPVPPGVPHARRP